MALTTVNSGGIKDDSIVNADIKSDAAIAGSKISPDFGSQDITISDNIIHSGDTNTKIRFPAADTVSVEAGGLEKLRIEGDYTGTVDVKGSPAHLRLNSSRDTSDWDATDPIGKIDYYVGLDTTNNLPYNAGFIHCLNETENADEPSGALVFGTSTANASGGAVERLRISSSGQLLLGTTTEGNGDADELTISGTRTGITIRSANDDYGNIFFSDATSGASEYVGAVQYYHADNSLRFKTSSNDRLLIDSSGKVGIGTTPAYHFHVKHAGATEAIIGSSDAGSATLMFDGDSNGDGSGSDYSHIRHGTDGHMEYVARAPGTNRHHIFKTNGGTATTTAEVFRVTEDGITFGGSTGAANALSDYETGSWTPTLPGGGNMGIYNASYTKIGRMVSWWAYIYPQSVPNDSTGFTIGGFPFTSGSTSNMGGSAVCGYSGSLDTADYGFYKNTGDTNMSCYFIGGGSVGGTIQNQHLHGATRYFALSGTYYTN